MKTKHVISLLLVGAFVLAGSAFAQGVLSKKEQELTVKSYNIGTDIGAMYLAENTPRLRVTLLLQECGSKGLADALGQQLPASFNYFYTKYERGTLPDDIIVVAAQITNAYVLGYEVGVRTEFRRMSEDEKKKQCLLVAAAAGQMLP